MNPDESKQTPKAESSEFIYSPLQPEEIYIVILEKGDEEDPISCMLERRQLGDESTSYEALSYAWGDHSHTMAISLNRNEFNITHNLFIALKQLRSQTSDRRLWIDALCIDQSNTAMRNLQVRHMHGIYANAHRVLAWIGIGDDEFENISFMVSQAEVAEFNSGFMMRLAKMDFMPRMTGPFARLLRRDYWSRLWVIQEILHAKQVQVLCGPYEISYESLRRFLRKLHSATSQIPDLHNIHYILSFGASHLIPERELAWTSERPIDVGRLLALINLKECSDPRDRIFGIHSILPADLQSRIAIDYSISASELFTSATKAIIERDGIVDIITRKPVFEENEITRSDIDLPSWAINWMKNGRQRAFSSFDTFNAAGNIRPFFEFFGDNLLRTRGVRIGRVEHVLGHHWGHESVHSLRITTFVEHCKIYLEQLRAIYPIDLATYTLTCMAGGPIENDEFKTVLCKYLLHALYGMNVELPDDTDHVFSDQLHFIMNKALFMFSPAKIGVIGGDGFDENGPASEYIGIGPKGMRPEDIICVLFGFKAPLILRPVGEYYELISDAYIRIYMQGEAVASLQENIDDLEEFVLK